MIEENWQGCKTSVKTKTRGLGLERYESPEASSRLGFEDGFFGTLRQCVLNTLTDVLGKPALGALVSHYHLDDKAGSPEQIHQILGNLFGNGAVVLEKLILREICKELGVPLEEQPVFEFQTAVLAAKESLRNNGRRSK